MSAVGALRSLRDLRVPVVTTADAAAAFGVTIPAASQTLRRLGAAGLVFSLRKGLWAVDSLPDRMSLVEYLTAPYPAYVSLQSALFLRGMIEQIPSVVYVVSLGRAAHVKTPTGTYSIHHLPAELFGGFDHAPESGVRLATPEKALFDLLYLSGTRSRLFRSLPELELPRGFRPARVKGWIRQVGSQRLRSITTRRFQELLDSSGC